MVANKLKKEVQDLQEFQLRFVGKDALPAVRKRKTMYDSLNMMDLPMNKREFMSMKRSEKRKELCTERDNKSETPQKKTRGNKIHNGNTEKERVPNALKHTHKREEAQENKNCSQLLNAIRKAAGTKLNSGARILHIFCLLDNFSILHLPVSSLQEEHITSSTLKNKTMKERQQTFITQDNHKIKSKEKFPSKIHDVAKFKKVRFTLPEESEPVKFHDIPKEVATTSVRCVGERAKSDTNQHALRTLNKTMNKQKQQTVTTQNNHRNKSKETMTFKVHKKVRFDLHKESKPAHKRKRVEEIHELDISMLNSPKKKKKVYQLTRKCSVKLTKLEDMKTDTISTAQGTCSRIKLPCYQTLGQDKRKLQESQSSIMSESCMNGCSSSGNDSSHELTRKKRKGMFDYLRNENLDSEDEENEWIPTSEEDESSWLEELNVRKKKSQEKKTSTRRKKFFDDDDDDEIIILKPFWFRNEDGSPNMRDENTQPGYEAEPLSEALNEPCAAPQQPSTLNSHNLSKELPQNTTATPAEVLSCTEASSRCFTEGLEVNEQLPSACNRTTWNDGMPERDENTQHGYEAEPLSEPLNEPCAAPQQPLTLNGHNLSKELPQNTTATLVEVLPCTEVSRCFTEGLEVNEQLPSACNRTTWME